MALSGHGNTAINGCYVGDWVFVRVPSFFSAVPGALVQISVGADGSVWGVSANRMETFNSTTQSFQAAPNTPPLAQVSVGEGGDVWRVDTSGNIFEYVASSQTWNNISGELNFIQVGANGAIWGINAAGRRLLLVLSTCYMP